MTHPDPFTDNTAMDKIMSDIETPTYRHTPEMGEISIFGGEYEDACQKMLENGVKWLHENAERRDMKGGEYRNVFGLMTAESDDAKALEKAMMVGVEDCSGAMHHAVMRRLFYISANGWEKYCSEILKAKAS